MTEQTTTDRYSHAVKNMLCTATRVNGYATPVSLVRVGFWLDEKTGKVYEVADCGMYWNGINAESKSDAINKIFLIARYSDFMAPKHFGKCTMLDITPEYAAHWLSLPVIEAIEN